VKKNGKEEKEEESKEEEKIVYLSNHKIHNSFWRSLASLFLFNSIFLVGAPNKIF